MPENAPIMPFFTVTRRSHASIESMVVPALTEHASTDPTARAIPCRLKVRVSHIPHFIQGKPQLLPPGKGANPLWQQIDGEARHLGRLIASQGWSRSRGFGCSPMKALRELGLKRRETVWSLSTVGAGFLRGSVPVRDDRDAST